ncbi:MAG TPA: hypothetical protein VJC18_03020, partial [bacterium]|nr:hypothetical protein [bacterium]
VIGSRIASYIWSACRSNGSGSSLKNILYADSTESCAISSGSGSTDSSMTLMATGTGTLQVFVADCAPIVLDGLTIQSGQTLSVNAQCTALSADIAPGDVTNNSDNASSSSTESTAVTCDGISGLIATNSPADPSLSDYVTVTATTIPPASGCSVNYSMSGTDGYAQSATLTTDAAGAISFTIPPAEIEGIVDTVITTESASGKSSTITYVF